MMARTFRVAFDTNEVVAARSRWLDTCEPTTRRNIHLRLFLVVVKRHQGLYCDEILDEYSRVLLERHHPPERIRRLISLIAGSFYRIVVTSEQAPVRPTDPDDEIFLLCALDGDADYLASEDKHLLRFRPHYYRPTIANCSELVEVTRWSSVLVGLATPWQLVSRWFLDLRDSMVLNLMFDYPRRDPELPGQLVNALFV